MKRRNVFQSSLCALCAFVGSASSDGQSGAVDTRFDAGINGEAEVSTIIPLDDGRIVIGGSFTNISGTAISCIARLREDGSLDRSFIPGLFGPRTPAFLTGGLVRRTPALALQTDGKLLAGFDRLFRVNIDATVDRNFIPALNLNEFGQIRALALQADGRIIVGGSRLVRLNSDGSSDTTFKPTINFLQIDAVWVQFDGKVLVTAAVPIPGNNMNLTTVGTYRLNSDGSTDNVVRVIPPGYVFAEQTDGKVLLGSYDIRLINEDGSLDDTFDARDQFGAAVTELNGLALQSDGKLIAGGSFGRFPNTTETNVVRFFSDGSRDPTFQGGVTTAATFVNPPGGVRAIAIDRNGDVLVGGHFTSFDGIARTGMVRLVAHDSHPFAPVISQEPLGQTAKSGRTATFSVRGYGFPYPTYQWQRNGTNIPSAMNRVLVLSQVGTSDAGAYSVQLQNSIGRVSSAPAILEVKRFPPGSLDPSFHPDLDVHPYLGAIGLQSDGKIIVSGVTEAGDLTFRKKLNRITSSGKRDESFVTDSDFESVRSILIQNDGRILLFGDFGYQNRATNLTFLARLMPDGKLDRSFKSNITADRLVRQVALQSDGKIIVSGGFHKINGIVRPYLARLQTNGELDLTFSPTWGQDSLDADVFALLVQTDDKIVYSGQATLLPSFYERQVARLNPDGSFDPSFHAILNPTAITVITGIPGSDQILVGGSAGLWREDPNSTILRLNHDGSIDPTFRSPIIQSLSASGPFRGTVRLLRPQSDGKIFMAGDFSIVDGERRVSPVRLQLNGRLDSDFNPEAGGNVTYLVTDPQGRLLINYYGNDFGIARLLGEDKPPPPSVMPLGFTGGNFSVSFEALADVRYTLELKRSGIEQQWTTIGSILGDGTEKQMSDPNATDAMRFYRVTAE